MLVMGIDTSREIGAIGLVSEQGVLGEINVRLYRQHSERLLPNIDFILKETGFTINDLEGIGVTIGPGSFTGLRIALATVKTFVQVLNIPVIGISTLDHLAYNLTQKEGWLVPVIDARRERVYTALYHNWAPDIRSRKKWSEKALPLSQLIEELKKIASKDTFYLIGDGCREYRDYFSRTDLNIEFAPDSVSLPRGGSLAELSRYYLQQGIKNDYLELLPNYLKKPQAEINWLKKHTDD